ncbi:hypothetical protein [Litoreibacter roseus]|uniref:Uncharacterized protein n=1 Tax=Litoreibacter roseus TaxID=2601869 RepID=A0A6N6JLW0_9RHOB|nr:hypothetical protein [Litoreibacter roseus]GFE66957.1 hypothetical protein KIN_40310 [Litoreibacter roseus]
MKPILNILRWFKRTRETHSTLGHWVHFLGQWIAVGLMIYWWRAMLHLLDTVEAFVAGWRTSTWEGFGFLDGLWAIPVHLVSEPVYFGQLCAITLVCYLTVNRQGYGDRLEPQTRLNHGGAKIFATMMLFRR